MPQERECLHVLGLIIKYFLSPHLLAVYLKNNFSLYQSELVTGFCYTKSVLNPFLFSGRVKLFN